MSKCCACCAVLLNHNHINVIYVLVDKRKKRMAQKVSEVCADVSNKKIPPYSRCLTLEICCNDADGEGVEVPFVQYVLPRKK